MDTHTQFHNLFKKFRLKSQFESLSQFGAALAEEGRIYEDSIFTHWQNGKRIPRDRSILLTILKIFIKRGGITILEEANNFLESAGQGHLTEKERQLLYIENLRNIPFQVPNEIANFIGREDIVDQIKRTPLSGRKILIHGPSGVGKTALAIHIAHQLKDHFYDGILWYKVDATNPMDILLSIAYTFNENIGPIQDIHARSSFVRSLLASKKILLILDNVEKETNLNVLLPNSSITVLFTSKYKQLAVDTSYETISLSSFNRAETINLFTKITTPQYTKRYQSEIEKLAEKVDFLPLALQIYAKHLKMTTKSPSSIIRLIEKNEIPLKELSYEDKNLYQSINISTQSLDPVTKEIFFSLGIFEGKDFSLQTIAAINRITIAKTLYTLQKLQNASLIDKSTEMRYRIHPLIKRFINEQSPQYVKYCVAAEYYAKFLYKYKRKNTKFYSINDIYPEKDNILYILEACLKQKSYKEALKIWNNLGRIFVQTGEWEKILTLGKKIYYDTKNDNAYYTYDYAKITLDILARIYFFLGDIEKAENLVLHERKISHFLQNEYLINLNKQHLGKIYQGLEKFDDSLKLLTESLPIIKMYNDVDEEAYTCKFIGEVYLFKNDPEKAQHYLERTFQIVKNTKDMILLAIILVTLGSVYLIQKQHIKAERFVLKSIEIEKKYKIRMGMKLFSYLILALIKKEQGKMSESIRYFQMAKNENKYLHIGSNAKKIYAIVFLLYNKLKEANYYIFD